MTDPYFPIADEKLSAFVELESAIRGHPLFLWLAINSS